MIKILTTLHPGKDVELGECLVTVGVFTVSVTLLSNVELPYTVSECAYANTRQFTHHFYP